MWQIYYFAKLLDDSKGAFPQPPTDKDQLTSIFNLIYITIGAIGVFLVVLSGFRYVMAQGDPQKIATAKNTLLYTLIGVVAVGGAVAVVQFVLGALD